MSARSRGIAIINSYLAIADLAAAIFAFTASRLKLAPFCIGGNSIAVMASFSTCCCTKTKRQNSYLNHWKYLRAGLGAVLRPARALEGIEAEVGQIRDVNLGLVAEPATGLVDKAVLVVADAHGAELAFAEVPDLVTLRRALAG